MDRVGPRHMGQQQSEKSHLTVPLLQGDGVRLLPGRMQRTEQSVDSLLELWPRVGPLLPSGLLPSALG